MRHIYNMKGNKITLHPLCDVKYGIYNIFKKDGHYKTCLIAYSKSNTVIITYRNYV